MTHLRARDKQTYTFGEQPGLLEDEAHELPAALDHRPVEQLIGGLGHGQAPGAYAARCGGGEGALRLSLDPKPGGRPRARLAIFPRRGGC